MLYPLLRPILYSMDAECAHYRTMNAYRALYRMSGVRSLMGIPADDGLDRSVQHMGIRFRNPVGLAAGFDKNGQWIAELASLGFGFIEVGTVTPRPQIGNAKPRLFRLQKDKALINRMGFNNDGVEALAQRLERYQRADVIIGGNIGKNKDTPNEDAIADYDLCFRRLQDLVDYFVVNVSSPNTPGLRALQEREPLIALLSHLQNINQRRSAPVPILLKIAPDLSEHQLDDIASIVMATSLSGIIATNTTISRTHLQTPTSRLQAIGNGGLSGSPLRERANHVLRHLRTQLSDEVIIIGVGGIHAPEHAREKMEAGAQLVQIYTGMIYEGPGIVNRIVQSLP